MEMRYIAVRRRKRRTLKGAWGTLAWVSFLLVLGIGGMVVCSISAIQTGRLRIMIAYSSGAQIGYIYMGLGMGTQAALLAALLQIVAHAVTKPMLFLSGAGLAGASGGHQDFRSLRGAAHRAPAAGVLFTIGALSMVGIPIFAGFIPKLYFATAAAATPYLIIYVYCSLFIVRQV